MRCSGLAGYFDDSIDDLVDRGAAANGDDD